MINYPIIPGKLFRFYSSDELLIPSIFLSVGSKYFTISSWMTMSVLGHVLLVQRKSVVFRSQAQQEYEQQLKSTVHQAHKQE